MPKVALLDVEASGLGDGSDPIEIGWVLLDGTSGSVLVAPLEEWLAGEWDKLAAEVHQISLADLSRSSFTTLHIALRWYTHAPLAPEEARVRLAQAASGPSLPHR